MDTLDYNITEAGRIYSLKPNSRARTLDNEILPHITNSGYYQVTLRVEGKSKKFKIHQLVAKKYIPNLNNLPEVNHKDGIKTNNHKDNLEWCTRLDNVRHSIVNKLKPMGEKHHFSKWTDKQMEEVKILLKEGKNDKEISDKTGVSKNSIYKERINKGRL